LTWRAVPQRRGRFADLECKRDLTGVAMHGMSREIAGVLVLKLTALAVLYFAFFAHAPAETPQTVATHMTGR
jgi:hypothetical protein